ncbi:MAG: DNA-processing protein DprA [Campylobacterales bacterium]
MSNRQDYRNLIYQLPSIPKPLQEINQPPKTLYAIGNLSLLERPKVAIVGSRRALRYSIDYTRQIASAVATAGGVVVSGAAMGIDAAAHEGASARATIAIMGNSLDLLQPAANRSLIERIYNEGLALSEYPVTTPATRYSFVARNRLVVGLADAVLIAQADEQSGSMHSAKLALAMKKPLFVLPQRLGESDGTVRLAAKGEAKLLTSVNELLEILSLTTPSGPKDDDPFLAYCATSPIYDEALARYGSRLFEAELLGIIEIKDGRVRLV